MRTKIMLSTATAIALLTGAAQAGDNNTLYLDQDGERNSASVSQGLGSDSDVGTSGDAALQIGSDNRFTFAVTNWGTNNNNDIVNLEQNGTWNLFQAQAAGSSSNNVLSNFLQQGGGNSVNLNWTAASNGSIDSISIIGDRNAVSILQGNATIASSGNTVGTVSILGSRNGGATGNQWAHDNWSAGIHIRQVGTGNNVDRSEIEGDDNRWPSMAVHTVHKVFQTGNSNGTLLSTAITRGSDGNQIYVEQSGDANQFDVRQGTDTTSTQNFVTLDQTGTGNTATVLQTGSYNTADLSFTGDRNGAADNTGVAGSFGPGFNDRGLTQGTVTQLNDGALDNAVTYDVFGDDNLFAFKQDGTGNTISGSVGDGLADSSGNQVAVLQTGDGNVTSFSQIGAGGNTLSVSQ